MTIMNTPAVSDTTLLEIRGDIPVVEAVRSSVGYVPS